jgi:adhesin transport system outer membrane protein
MELRNLFFRAVMTALERSPQVRSTEFQVEAAKEDVSNAKGQRWPQVDVNSNSRRYEFGKGNRNASENNLPSFGVSVSRRKVNDKSCYFSSRCRSPRPLASAILR